MSEITCPHCYCVCDSEEMELVKDTELVECDGCGKEYFVDRDISYSVRVPEGQGCE